MNLLKELFVQIIIVIVGILLNNSQYKNNVIYSFKNTLILFFFFYFFSVITRSYDILLIEFTEVILLFINVFGFFLIEIAIYYYFKKNYDNFFVKLKEIKILNFKIKEKDIKINKNSYNDLELLYFKKIDDYKYYMFLIFINLILNYYKLYFNFLMFFIVIYYLEKKGNKKIEIVELILIFLILFLFIYYYYYAILFKTFFNSGYDINVLVIIVVLYFIFLKLKNKKKNTEKISIITNKWIISCFFIYILYFFNNIKISYFEEDVNVIDTNTYFNYIVPKYTIVELNDNYFKSVEFFGMDKFSIKLDNRFKLTKNVKINLKKGTNLKVGTTLNNISVISSKKDVLKFISGETYITINSDITVELENEKDIIFSHENLGISYIKYAFLIYFLNNIFSTINFVFLYLAKDRKNY